MLHMQEMASEELAYSRFLIWLIDEKLKSPDLPHPGFTYMYQSSTPVAALVCFTFLKL